MCIVSFGVIVYKLISILSYTGIYTKQNKRICLSVDMLCMYVWTYTYVCRIF